MQKTIRPSCTAYQRTIPTGCYSQASNIPRRLYRRWHIYTYRPSIFNPQSPNARYKWHDQRMNPQRPPSPHQYPSWFQSTFNRQVGVCATVYHDCTVYNKNPIRRPLAFWLRWTVANVGPHSAAITIIPSYSQISFPFLFLSFSPIRNGAYAVVMSLILILGGVSCSFRHDSEPLPLFSVLMLSMLLCCYQRSVGLLAFAFQTKYYAHCH